VDRSELITPDTPLAFVDVETTGCAFDRSRVIDVAVIGVRGDELEFEWQSLVNPGARIPDGITALTGIDNDMLADAPAFDDIAREVRARLEGRVFVAHNVRFDYGFIRREFARTGGEWRAPNLCTVRLSRALYPRDAHHNLDAVMERHGIQVANRHRALPDAQVLLEFWRQLRASWPRETLQHALEIAAMRANLPAALSPDLGDDLPEAAGVYRLFGAGEDGAETLLYVGKANNLRERVLDHFRVGTSDAKALRLASQVRRVEWTQTAGELGALLLEAREIRESQPVYNRQLRGNGERFTWLFDDDATPPRLTELSAEVLHSGNAFGTYRAAHDARRALESLARDRRWCLKVLGLESGAGSCFGFQVGRCNGACIGHETAAVHLTRVKLELMPQRLRQWPYDGPMVLREGLGERVQYHVIDGWQHLETFDGDDAAMALEEFGRSLRRPRAGRFDIDGYRILTRHLGNARLVPLPRHREDSWV
jgi:DNA polymerase-3 subunit epsilon